MGVCWLARIQGKHGFEKLVAIKMMKPEYALDPVFQRMFVDEAKIASGIEHANVAAILDIGDKDGALYLAMEYVDGDALNKLMRELRTRSVEIPMGIALRILADTCGGLHAAHDLVDSTGNPLGVVHRDVSPQNILINVKGVAKLIDFGIAKARDRTSGDTSLGTIKGKIHYMAPEQAIGRGDLDRRADVFSVGAILYQLLSGKRAFEAESEVATILLLASGRPPLPMPKTVPAPVVAVIMKALQHDRTRRFATALEMQQALDEAMVQSNLVTPNAVVADFIKEHLGHRAEKRRRAIELALAAISGAKSAASGMEKLSAGQGDSAPRSTSEISSTRLGIGAPPGTAGAEGAPAGQPADADGNGAIAVLALNTDPTTQTLSASSVSDAQRRPPAPRNIASIAVLVGGPMLALAGIVLGFVALRHHENSAPPVAAETGSEATTAPATSAATMTSASASASTSAATANDSPPASESASASADVTASPPGSASATATATTTKGRDGAGRPHPATGPTATTTSVTKKKKKAVDDGF